MTKDWTRIGTRSDLTTHVSIAAGISETLITLYCSQSPDSVSAAEKLSWIATRTTSRLEDEAYCLMGLFDINMPLLYREGNKAFRRLQLEILKSSNDESIFIWDIPIAWPWAQGRPALSGLLTSATTDFGPFLYHRHKDDRLYMFGKVPGVTRPPYTITNQGLELRIPKRLATKSEFFLPLNCRCFDGSALRGVYAILLQKIRSAEFQEPIWHRSISRTLPKTLPNLPRIEYQDGLSVGLFVAPESWLWTREQLAEVDVEVIYVRL